jgi:hypothetical protein
VAVTVVAASGTHGQRGMMRSALQIKLASEAIADQHYHFEKLGYVDPAFVRDDHLPGIMIRPYRNRHIRGPLADFLHSTRMMASRSAAVLVGFFIRPGPGSASKASARPVW